MFYISAGVAIVGAVAYQYFVKRVPASLNPIVSVMGMYVAVLALGVILLPFFSAEGGLRHHFRQLSWIQLALAVSVMMIELGFLLMYRYGWNLSTGNLVTGVFVNLILVGLGVSLLGEKVNLVNAFGIAFCVLGVALISYRAGQDLPWPDESLLDWAGGTAITVDSVGEGPPVTTLAGGVDPAALQGLLRQLHSLSLPLISVICVEKE